MPYTDYPMTKAIKLATAELKPLVEEKKKTKDKKQLKVVHDQIGSPTSTLELSPALWDLARSRETGVFHAACEGQASWFEFACETFHLAGVQGVEVSPCTTAEFPRPARRPAYSTLDCSRLAKLRGKAMAHWRDALARYLKET